MALILVSTLHYVTSRDLSEVLVVGALETHPKTIPWKLRMFRGIFHTECYFVTIAKLNK